MRNGSTSRGDHIDLSDMQGNNGILINGSVVVSKDGTGNFTTIEKAVEMAPRNLKAEEGYFVIYVREGVYEEYITISRNKNNILLIGDGINATVITGDHSNEDGWVSYNSATFGK